MGITSEDPTKDPLKDRQDWEYLAPDRGKTLDGYFAAPPLWITVHHEHGSRPCRRVVSKGALSCPMCACEAKSVKRGYVPWYSHDLVPSFYVSPEKYRLALSLFQPGDQVMLLRGKKVYDAVVMRAEVVRPLKLPASLPVGDQVNLLPSLLRMWKDVQLERWHRETTPSDTPVSPTADAPEGVPEELARRAAEGRRARSGAEELAHLVGKVTENLNWPGKPSKNGTHPPPSE